MSNHGVATASINLPSVLLSPATTTACNRRSDTGVIARTLADITPTEAVTSVLIIVVIATSNFRAVEPQAGHG